MSHLNQNKNKEASYSILARCKLPIITFLLLYVSTVALSQAPIVSNVIPPSPEAQTFQRYGEIPVDYSTGVPDIRVPLYEISSGKLKLPIALTYNSSGIKVNDIASVAGLGWRLSAGGVLTKTVMGQPDNNPNYGMFSHPYLTKSQIDALPQNGSQWNELNFMSNGTYDNESDKYFYSCGDNLSGEFIYDHSFNIVQVTYTDNQVIGLNPASNGSGPTAYEVIDENGNKYYFESQESSQTGSDPTKYVSSWWLSQIISFDNADTISFQYQQYGNNEVVFTPSHTYTTSSVNAVPSLGGSYTYTAPLLLTKITFKNGYINFNYASDRKDMQYNRLTSVGIYNNGSTSPIKQYQFTQSYFNSGANNQYNYRLKLTQVSAYDGSGQHMGDYSFKYNESYTMPPYIQGNANDVQESYGQDYYGYYNGVSSNSCLVIGAPGVSVNRNPDVNYAQTCILNEIDYPTGGSDIFTYQLNDGASGMAQYGAGLRVHQITSKTDANTVAGTKRYEYANNLLQNNMDVSNYTQYEWYPIVYNSNCTWVAGDWITYTSGTIVPFTSFHGGQVLYQNVDEYDDNSTTNISLKRSYLYQATNDTIISVTSARYNNQYYEDCPWRKGQLESVSDYKYSPTAGYVLKKSAYYTYSDFRSSVVNVGTKVERLHPIVGNCVTDQYVSGNTYQQYFSYFDVPIVVGTRKLTGTQATEYDDNNNSIIDNVSTAYTSPSHLMPTQETKKASDGSTRITNLKYCYDFSGTPVYDHMIALHRISPVVEELNYKNSTSNFLSSQKTDYSFWANNQTTTSVTDQVYPLTVSTKKASVTNNYDPRVEYDNYDAFGNILQQRKVLSAPTAYIWGYNKQFPIAQATNATLNDIFYQNFEETEYSGTLNDAHTGHHSKTGGYSHLLSGLDNGSYVLSYWIKSGASWTFQKQPATVSGGTYTINISSAYQVDDVCFYPALSQMTSFTFDPLIGETSMTDPSGKTTYYEYDPFQRLTNIKDENGNIIKHIDYHYLGQ